MEQQIHGPPWSPGPQSYHSWWFQWATHQLQDHTFQVNIAVAQSLVVIATASHLQVQHPQVLTWGKSTPGTYRSCLSERVVHSLGPVRSWCMACWAVASRPEMTSWLVGVWMRHPPLTHLLIRHKCLLGKGTCGPSCSWPCCCGPVVVQGIFNIGEADNVPEWARHQGHSHKHWQSPEAHEVAEPSRHLVGHDFSHHSINLVFIGLPQLINEHHVSSHINYDAKWRNTVVSCCAPLHNAVHWFILTHHYPIWNSWLSQP